MEHTKCPYCNSPFNKNQFRPDAPLADQIMNCGTRIIYDKFSNNPYYLRSHKCYENEIENLLIRLREAEARANTRVLGILEEVVRELHEEFPSEMALAENLLNLIKNKFQERVDWSLLDKERTEKEFYLRKSNRLQSAVNALNMASKSEINREPLNEFVNFVEKVTDQVLFQEEVIKDFRKEEESE